VFLEEGLSEMDLLLIHLEGLNFHVCLNLVQAWLHFLKFSFLPCKGVQQPYFDDADLGKAPI
jgi:hypothetical protein